MEGRARQSAYHQYDSADPRDPPSSPPPPPPSRRRRVDGQRGAAGRTCTVPTSPIIACGLTFRPEQPPRTGGNLLRTAVIPPPPPLRPPQVRMVTSRGSPPHLMQQRRRRRRRRTPARPTRPRAMMSPGRGAENIPVPAISDGRSSGRSATVLTGHGRAQRSHVTTPASQVTVDSHRDTQSPGHSESLSPDHCCHRVTAVTADHREPLRSGRRLGCGSRPEHSVRLSSQLSSVQLRPPVAASISAESGAGRSGLGRAALVGHGRGGGGGGGGGGARSALGRCGRIPRRADRPRSVSQPGSGPIASDPAGPRRLAGSGRAAGSGGGG